MPTTRKKVIKTVYKDEDSEGEDGDFSDSGSDAKFSGESSSEEDEEVLSEKSSGDEFNQKGKSKQTTRKARQRKPKFAKNLIAKINKQMSAGSENGNTDMTPALFSIKDLSAADKLLPPILNLSESDSSEDESPKSCSKIIAQPAFPEANKDASDNEDKMEYKDVWSNNIQDDSEEIAKKTFLELELHKSKIEEAKASLQSYTLKPDLENESNVKDLLAQGEEVLPDEKSIKKKIKAKKRKDDSDSEMEDWEEVNETKGIPQQGIQLFVEFPDGGCRKRKKIDVEMMMKRKINRVKKEYQVYMHKVHILCWLGHGNYVSSTLNDQELMTAALSLVPSKECYPGERVDMKYVEQITTWYKDKLTLKQDRNEDKYRPKAPPLKKILLEQIKCRIVTTRKYLVFIFVSMLRALGLQCRVMLNFVTLPIKPPSFELCSLSTKPKDEKSTNSDKSKPEKSKQGNIKKDENKNRKASCSTKSKKNKVSQIDGNDDSDFSSDFENIMQVDGSNDAPSTATRNTRATKRNAAANTNEKLDEDVSPPKIVRRSPGRRSPKPTEKEPKKTQRNIGDKSKPEEDTSNTNEKLDEDVSPPKLVRISPDKKSKYTEKENLKQERPRKTVRNKNDTNKSKDKSKGCNDEKNSTDVKEVSKTVTRLQKSQSAADNSSMKNNNLETHAATASKSKGSKDNKKPVTPKLELPEVTKTVEMPDKSTSNSKIKKSQNKKPALVKGANKLEPPKITVTDDDQNSIASKYFNNPKPAEEKSTSRLSLSRKRSETTNPSTLQTSGKSEIKQIHVQPKVRTKSAPGSTVEKSKYFAECTPTTNTLKSKGLAEDKHRVSHRDLAKTRTKASSDVTDDLVDIIKKRIKDTKEVSKKGVVKGKVKKESEDDSDYLPEEDPKQRKSGESDDDFKPTKISPKPSTSRKIDRRVLTPDELKQTKKIDVWCEIFVEELEQWISVDIIRGKIHNANDFYNNSTHPVCYIIGWDNNNYLKDLTRKYVPHWNTVTRKLRAEPAWWDQAVRPWLGPNTARNREEDEYLDRMQMEAPLPTSIAEYKNHPLYALKRHLLKYEAIYPPDAAVLGFVRGEAVHARECVYTCRSRDTWLKEAKVVKLGEQPYKVVKARPKWDKLSNKLITDKPLEVFGPWQVQDYEPPIAENGMVPRNAYGNVELFKDCMLPVGTVHLKLPGLNRVAKKLNIDCAPAMTGFDFNGGWSHPVYDGFVVCKEFEEIITDAWVKDQEEQERREREKTEARVYGNWKKLIKGLLIRERLKYKYGFEEPTTSQPSKGKAKGPKLVVKKRS